MDSDRRLLYLAVNRITSLLPRDKRRLAETLVSWRELLTLSRERLAGITGRALPRATIDPAGWVKLGRQDELDLTEGLMSCTFYGEETYPPSLANLPDPPLVLFGRGGLPTGSAPRVAVVGTRNATADALQAAYEVGATLSRAGLSVVSGLARGIDAAAHYGTIEGIGSAVAVLGTGIDRLYPPSSASLGRKILTRGGCVVSEYPPGTPPRRYQFPARNRIIAGLASAVVVVQAPARSGALITADFALDCGIDVFVHEAGLGGEGGAGTLELARSGAEVVSSGEDVLSELGFPIAERPALAEEKTLDVGKQLARELQRELEQRV